MTEAKQIDLCFFDSRHTEKLPLAGIPFYPAAGNVLFAQSISYTACSANSLSITREPYPAPLQSSQLKRPSPPHEIFLIHNFRN